MPRAHHHRKEEGAERSQEGNHLRFAPQQFLSQLNHPIHATSGLQHTCTGHSSYNDVDDVGRGSARLQLKTKHQQSQSNARDSSQSQTTISRAHIESQQHNK